MKKLLAVTAMAALVAGAAFAYPSFSLSGKQSFNLAEFDTNGNYKVLTAPAASGGHSTSWAATVAGEKTKVTVGDGGTDATFTYKPVDMLTLGVTTGKYTIGLDLSPVTVDVTLPGTILDNGTFAKNQVVKVTYKGGDLGTLWVQYTNKDLADIVVDYKNTVVGVTAESKTTINLSKSGDDVVTMLTEFVEVSGKAADVSYKANTTLENITADARKIGVYAEASVPVSDVTVYCNATDENVLANTFAMTANVGVKGTYEVIGWDVSLNAVVNGSTVTFKLPVVLSASF